VEENIMNKVRHLFTVLSIIVFTMSSFLASSVLAELPKIDAYQVAVNVDELEDGDDGIYELEMTLINKRGQERIRQVISYRKDYGEDSKTVMFFKEPADVKGTGFLSWNYDDDSKDDDQWLYLPALKKVRRISTGKKADYFMGTDVIDSIETYHIELLPKSKDVIKKTGYGRAEVWVRPDIWMVAKTTYYDKKLKFLKELTVNDIEQIDGIWTVKTMTMVNERKKHTTIFTLSNIKYNTGLDDEIFSQRRLKKGIQ